MWVASSPVSPLQLEVAFPVTLSVSVIPGNPPEQVHRPLDAWTIAFMSASSSMYADANFSYSPTSC